MTCPSPILVDADQSAALAQRLAPLLRAGDVLLLEGEIGAGKTHFARALIQSLLTEPEDVPSPTFTLVQVYDTPEFEIWHADLYRLTDPDQILELGLEEAFETSVCLIEWPDRLQDLSPPGALTLTFTDQDDGALRRIGFAAGPQSGWAARLAGAFA